MCAPCSAYCGGPAYDSANPGIYYRRFGTGHTSTGLLGRPVFRNPLGRRLEWRLRAAREQRLPVEAGRTQASCGPGPRDGGEAARKRGSQGAADPVYSNLFSRQIPRRGVVARVERRATSLGPRLAKGCGHQPPSERTTEVATTKAKRAVKERRTKRKPCNFCAEKALDINYKDVGRLKKFISERGKILPRRISGNCARHQRLLTVAVKRARVIAFLPFVTE